jgi:enamine deaminase RidA (YjgF/YER057c/UK114 family)
VISGVIGVRLGRTVVAAAIEEPMSVALGMVDTGIEAFGHTTKDEGDDLIDVQVRCMVDAAADLAFQVSRTTLAAATDVYPNVALGLSVSRYHARATASGSVRADGIVSYGGQEYAFNDPSAPWDNELGMTAHGLYEGAAFGWNVGASWHPIELVTVDASFASMPPLKLEGSLTTVSNAMPGLIDGELNPDQILDSQPTLTERTETVEDDPVTLLLPSHGGLAVSLHAPFVLATIEYRRFTGAFGFEYQDVSEGVDIKDGFGLELDFGGVRVGGGVIRGKLMGDSLDGGSAGEDILIPLANLGLGIDIGQNMRLDTMVLAVPLQVLRLSLGYEF